MGETVLEASLNDPTSYSLNVMSHDSQAKKHPDFIGDAFYYNLTNQAAHGEIAGEYFIMYTRPLDRACDQKPLSASFPPDFQRNKIILLTEPSSGNIPIEREIRRNLNAGNLASGPMAFEGVDFMLTMPSVPNTTSSANRHAARIKAAVNDLNDTDCSKNPFMGRAVKGTGCTISFGMKVTDEKLNESGENKFWGFHFLKLEVPCCRTTGRILETMVERQLIVAVKLPSNRDISTFFALKQELRSSRDLAILNLDPRARDVADWVVYTRTDQFIPPKPNPFWRPPPSSAVGLNNAAVMRLRGDEDGISEITGGFQAAVFELYLLNADDPVQELCNLIDWISPHVTDDMYAREKTLAVAKRYWECRYAGMTNELRLRAKNCQGVSTRTVYEGLEIEKESERAENER